MRLLELSSCFQTSLLMDGREPLLANAFKSCQVNSFTTKKKAKDARRSEYLYLSMRLCETDYPILWFCPDHELLVFLPQLVQALKFETYHSNALSQFLLEKALRSRLLVGQSLFWELKVAMDSEEKMDEEADGDEADGDEGEEALEERTERRTGISKAKCRISMSMAH